MASEPAAGDLIEIKVVLLGDMAVGKSSLVTQFVNNRFNPNPESTIRVNFQAKALQIDNQKLRCNIWDTAGQEKYRSLGPIYYRGADVAVVVYDITRRETFDTLQYWITQLRTMAQRDHQHIVIGIAANKADLAPAQRQIPREVGEQYAQEIGALFRETSAKTSEKVTELFVEAVKLALEHRKSNGGTRDSPSVKNITPTASAPGSKPTSSCLCG